MNESIKLQMSTSVKKQRSIGTSIELFSQDIDNYSFDITFTDLELQAGDQVEVLAKLHGGKTEHKSSANLVEVDGKLIARYVFDTKLIDSEGHVFCYVYLKRGDKSADVGAFYFEVDLSELDKVGGKIAEVYDGRYEDLLAGFEVKLQAYRDSLPQASEVRAEIDVILNQFGVDSQAKLNQYDADAQQVIEDNQTAFGLAESNRQSDYEQAEDSRIQASNQAVVDWEQGADALIGTVEGNESARVNAESTRETAETDRVSSESARKSNETTRLSDENERKSAEVIRLANEVDRVNAENVRSGFYEGFDGRLGDLESDRVALRNLVTNGDFSQGLDGWSGVSGFIIETATFGYPTAYVDRVNYDFGFHQDVQASTTDKLYIKLSYYISEHTNGELRLSVRDFGTFLNATVLPFDSAKKNQWQVVSAVVSKTNGIRLIEGGANATAKYHVSKAMVINLTQTFGAGNEPTKAEMDELIKITGYFEDITPTQKQLLNWQLKLMRQNRNALIAIGGTII